MGLKTQFSAPENFPMAQLKTVIHSDGLGDLLRKDLSFGSH